MKCVTVLDCAGAGLSFLSNKQFIGEIGKIVNEQYPECVKAVYIVNTPKAFHFVWPGIKPFIAAETRKKIHIYSSKSKALT